MCAFAVRNIRFQPQRRSENLVMQVASSEPQAVDPWKSPARELKKCATPVLARGAACNLGASRGRGGSKGVKGPGRAASTNPKGSR